MFNVYLRNDIETQSYDGEIIEVHELLRTIIKMPRSFEMTL